jgi:hypothetical protein
MAKIYISSTYGDLKEYREAVYHTLRQMRHDVIAMEDYVATDQRPLEKCLTDVAECDVYIGIFAWRYGHVPSKENPTGKSITELEYRKAGEEGKECLIFLLDETAPWLRAYMDDVTGEGDRGQRMAALRKELGEVMVSFFKTPGDLSNLVSVSLQELARTGMDR